MDASKFYQLDQDVFNTVLRAFPHMRFELEPRWNVQVRSRPAAVGWDHRCLRAVGD